MKITLRGRKVIGGLAEGEAVVTSQPVSFLGGVNPDTGVVVERGQEVEGECTAMINVEAEPIIAVRSAMGNIPMVDRLDQNPLEVIATGDHVKIDGDKGIVEVTKKE